MTEIEPAIIAITLVMASVFIPLGFIDGPAGIFYREFAFTIAIEIVLSGVVALTLTPSLCASFLRPHTERPRRSPLSSFFGWFKARYLRLEERYVATLSGSTARYVRASRRVPGRHGGGGALGPAVLHPE